MRLGLKLRVEGGCDWLKIMHLLIYLDKLLLYIN